MSNLSLWVVPLVIGIAWLSNFLGWKRGYRSGGRLVAGQIQKSFRDTDLPIEIFSKETGCGVEGIMIKKELIESWTRFNEK